jgi:hypothetical protein
MVSYDAKPQAVLLRRRPLPELDSILSQTPALLFPKGENLLDVEKRAKIYATFVKVVTVSDGYLCRSTDPDFPRYYPKPNPDETSAKIAKIIPATFDPNSPILDHPTIRREQQLFDRPRPKPSEPLPESKPLAVIEMIDKLVHDHFELLVDLPTARAVRQSRKTKPLTAKPAAKSPKKGSSKRSALPIDNTSNSPSEPAKMTFKDLTKQYNKQLAESKEARHPKSRQTEETRGKKREVESDGEKTAPKKPRTEPIEPEASAIDPMDI